MASSAISRRWLLRDLPRTYVLLLWTGLVVALLAYFVDWSMPRHDIKAPQETGDANGDNDEKLYTGSLIVPTRKHDQCWEFTFDNRTGAMRDGGYVNCRAAARHSEEQIPPGGADETRLREVGKAFRRGGS